MNLALALTYNLVLLAGTAYLVAVHDWDPLWFILAVGCMHTCKGLA